MFDQKLSAVLLIFCGLPAGILSAADRPNVVWIVSEDNSIHYLKHFFPGGAEAPNIEIYRGRGCEMCNNMGYKGRIGIYELMPITDEMRGMIMNNASTDDLRNVAKENGMRGLRDAGLDYYNHNIDTSERYYSEVITTRTFSDRIDTRLVPPRHGDAGDSRGVPAARRLGGLEAGRARSLAPAGEERRRRGGPGPARPLGRL